MYIEEMAKSDAEAQIKRGLIERETSWFLGREARVKEWFVKASKTSDAGSFHLGLWYLDHGEKAAAFKFFTKAGEGGHAGARCEMGKCYINGIGTAQDVEKGKERLIQSAKEGFGEAYYQLALLFKKENHISEEAKQELGIEGTVDECYAKLIGKAATAKQQNSLQATIQREYDRVITNSK